MGEARAKSRSRDEVLRKETRCIYCSDVPTSLEHMPPRIMFRNKSRPSGMEFASCRACNNGTSAADLVAAYFARLGAHEKPGHWAFDESVKLERKLEAMAPGVLRELHDPRRGTDRWVMNPAGVMERMRAVHADGPTLKAYLSVFSAKLAMAMYREHIGEPLPLDGGVEVLFFLNGGMSENILNVLLEGLPAYQTIRQGSFTSHSQFDYRYSTDSKTNVAGLVRLHTGMHVLFFSAAKPEEFGGPHALDGSEFFRPGELVQRIPIRIRTPA